jgi:A/G-specific adenine glycosylase
MVTQDFNHHFPDTPETLLMLPGIGRSTAAAILSIAFQQRAAILDGNVKRVLARFQGITQAINEKNIENNLWNLAEKYTPPQRTADYTQAMMDLGATLCVRRKPNCPQCPLAKHCIAHQQNLTDSIPQKKSTRKIPTRSAVFLIFQHQDRVLLHKRPASGIWGGLWSFPQINGEVTETYIHAYCRKHFPFMIENYKALTPFKHTFSHYHLDISPILIKVKRLSRKVADMEDTPQIWYNSNETSTIGLPKPIQMIMKELQ